MSTRVMEGDALVSPMERMARKRSKGHGLPRKQSRLNPGVFALAGLSALAFLLGAWHLVSLLYFWPAPWPDEALFADAGYRLARGLGFSSMLYREVMPSLVRHYYLTPPIHPLLLSLVFRFTPPTIAAVRAVSMLFALAVLALTVGIGHRLKVGVVASLAAAAALTLDPAFVRAAHVGRMDIVALTFLLLAVWLSLGLAAPSRSAGLYGRAVLAGIAAGCSALSHPIGIVALPASLAIALVGRREGRARMGVLLVAGTAAAMLPWMAYILQDRAGFMEQFGNQFARKAAEHRTGNSVLEILGQWPVPALWVAAVAVALATLRQAAPLYGRGVWLAFSLVIVVVLTGYEPWYAVDLAPLTYVGLAAGLSLLRRAGWRRILGAIAALLAIAVVAANERDLEVLESLKSRSGIDRGTYERYCRDVDAHLPERAVVLLDDIPTSWFGLFHRDDRLRFMRPTGFTTSSQLIRSSLEHADYAVVNAVLRDSVLTDWLNGHGTTVTEVGTRGAYDAKIVRLSH